MYRWVRERHMIGIRGRNFMEAPWAGGIVLLGCVIIAMLLANLPATSLYYRHLLETDLSLMVHSPDGLIDWVFPRGMTVEKLINDGLMVIFFFAVGCLGGIGFTMSLFVDALAYTEPDLIDRGKIAILMGSTAAAVAGSLLILIFSKKRT